MRAIEAAGNISNYDTLRLINQYLQIALSVAIFLLIFPTFWVANRITKDFGWDVYKKIGSSIKIQGKQ